MKEILVMVEIPKGSRNKYEYNPEDGLFYLDRMLFSAVHYPADYGFIRKPWRKTATPSMPWYWWVKPHFQDA